MTGADFDRYVSQYRDIINEVSSISGEQFEFFIQLRLGLMRERVDARLEAYMEPRVLDFGCGIGVTERYLQEHFPGARIDAVDSSAESINAALRLGLHGVSFRHCAGSTLPFPDECFDLIYSNGTYHHIEPAMRALFIQEMFRICKHGGSLFVFENNPGNPLMMRAMRKNPFDAGTTVVVPGELREMAETAGFAAEELSYYFFFPRCLRFLRGAEQWLRRVPLGAQYFLWMTKQ
jgi:SAM-dependent methyltransferase